MMDEYGVRIECLKLAQGATNGNGEAADKVVATAKTYADFVLGTRARPAAPVQPMDVRILGIEPTTADIGRSVTYHGATLAEEGVISSFNDHFVFVRFGDNAVSHSKACRRQDLSWAISLDDE